MNEALYLGRKEVLKGMRGERAFGEELKKIFPNCSVWQNPRNFEGVDIILYDKDGIPIHCFEITNYASKNFMSKPRAKRYIDSLNYAKRLNPNIKRSLVVSYPMTVDRIKGIRKMFQDEEIEIWVFKEV